MKIARTITRYTDYVEEFSLGLNLIDSEISAVISCPLKDEIKRLADIVMLDAEVGKIRVTVKNDQLQEFGFEDVYVILMTTRNSTVFNPMNLWLSVQRLP
ncbi:hypothetical protein EVB81_018 [Rhizobium phage RHph_I46]|uniref:Uncharacterized protein n=1 Tax=Rhizobium phage RHph_I1_9 TaxID=2509729 RepID=A0A7S5UWM7_9CAUD|nr:hypothetical protein PP936_gp018 [Rhizobium phage RHph_I1_9]QIG69587.1 hypothetical protein EVB81_018 [Rhizobium phage RHph_I46]QIG70868.1 hypothetical protein EVB92_018 [Rhizobium phage RHph_I9]QIG73455.1 hypothetical protein EVC04_018 [Rhizobium phage RHph_I1_9]QIG76207.1 hypothetical protein EVC25_018 [Rhizobium phage RHph_I34]